VAFEPRIVAFCCRYCASAAADLAGTGRLQYPPNVRIITFACSGKVAVLHLLRAFEYGADGVFVAGCEEGSCHFREGNLWARKRVARARGLLGDAGIDPARLEMYNLSASMGKRFAELAREFTGRIREMGPVWKERRGE
jgi:coenzyme F420-reducing hydrogenase delta subunit